MACADLDQRQPGVRAEADRCGADGRRSACRACRAPTLTSTSVPASTPAGTSMTAPSSASIVFSATSASRSGLRQRPKSALAAKRTHDRVLRHHGQFAAEAAPARTPAAARRPGRRAPAGRIGDKAAGFGQRLVETASRQAGAGWYIAMLRSRTVGSRCARRCRRFRRGPASPGSRCVSPS